MLPSYGGAKGLSAVYDRPSLHKVLFRSLCLVATIGHRFD